MKPAFFLAAAILASAYVPAFAQETDAFGLGEVIVTSGRQSARFAQQERPVVGLRRQADSVVVQVSFSSDSRDVEVRKREIQTMLLSAIDRAVAAGVELVNGSFDLIAVTKANYQGLSLYSAGRVDTSKADLMVKVKLAGSITTAQARLDTFIKGVPRTGRGTVDKTGALTLTIINPDQYRDAIIKLVAEDARRHATMFGADYAVQASGVDQQIFWSQVSSTDVFLYVPYRFTIVPK